MSKFMDWVDARFPATKMWEDHLSKYYAPKNFNFFYFFGSLALLVLVNQIVTGVWLTMSFTPSAEEAFASVEYIMRDVEYGWILRYLHSTGASAFFIVVYLHMFRGLLYGSYQKPRELVWVFGMLIYLALMAWSIVRMPCAAAMFAVLATLPRRSSIWRPSRSNSCFAAPTCSCKALMHK